MSAYGYESYGYAGYGYASYGYAPYGGYELSLSALNTARGELTGPGSSAYERNGAITSYAHENANGGLFQETTYSSGAIYRVAVSYDYAAGYYYYGAGYGSVGTRPFFSTDSYSHYSYFSNGNRYGVSEYLYSSNAHTSYGGYEHRTSVAFSYEAYGDGSYTQRSTAFSGLFTYAGQAVPGTATSSAVGLSYDAGTGYLSSYHTP